MPRRAITLVFALVVAPCLVTAQDPVHVDGLGSIAFPTSGSADAQPHFIRGVLLMHSFEYADAAEHFRMAQQIDPGFAMAYWGEAMTHLHAVWNEKDVAAARSILKRLAPTPEARLAKAPTHRERMYLDALEVLFGDGEKAALDTAYSRAMERLMDAHPEDDEAKAFFALSLLGLSQGERNVPTYMRAGAIALDLFERNPDHPGAAHYVIHSFDDPTHAPLGLEAARAYGPIAPDAAHAQHMTTHIFLALGMWDELVAANERAVAVVNASFEDRVGFRNECFHYSEWLQYGYQQQGRYADAGDLLRRCHEMVENAKAAGAPRNPANSFALMRAYYLVDTEAWDTPAVAARVDTADLSELGKNRMDYGTAYAAIHLGDPATAEAALAAIRSRNASSDDWGYEYNPIHEGVLTALLHRDAGDMQAALDAARRAAAYEAELPFDFGPPLAHKPPRELEGDLLLEMERYAEALTAYDLQLARTPDRARTLLGYARAAAKLGKDERATWAYGTLLEHWAHADEHRPELAEARAGVK